ncbi:hypothetical protein PFMALIP_03755 [Plasmodium falciparum MaliPS096_E11]|uniref:Uncharacterized protein n=1 Tax=Plasmodium falciparum MaliPS096_E11 TaxID=1036727 RepID=A0A024WLY6_PLAFA|nr:hypothetical protein PFMALIP_03755 [Plasmodium falciparum MaliPS096_E11]
MNIYLDNIFFLSFFITLCTYTEPYENITDLKYVQEKNNYRKVTKFFFFFFFFFFSCIHK